MNYFIRKIERSRWSGSDVIGGRIKADVVASCINPKRSELSVWFAESDDDIEKAKLAMLAAMNKLATVDFVVLPVDEIKEAGLMVAETLSDCGPDSLKPLHRDIHDLDLDSLKTVAKIIQRHVANNGSKRITRDSCKKILQGAIDRKEFRVDELHADIVKNLVSA